MNYTATTGSVVGGETTAKHWNQTLVTGRLFVVVEVTGEQAAVVGSKFLHQLQENLTSPPVSLIQCKKIIHQLAGPAISCAAAVLSETAAYLIIKGQGSIWVKRGQTVGLLLQGEGSLSGRIEPNDIFLLAAGNFTSVVNQQFLRRQLQSNDVTEISESLTTYLHKDANCPSTVALIFSLSSPRPPIITANLFLFLKRVLGKIRSLFLRFTSRLEPLPRVKPAFLIICVLLLLLGGSIWLGLREKKTEASQKEWEAVLTEVNHKYDEAVALIDLNPVRARQLLDEAKLALSRLNNLQLGKATDKELKEVQDKITSGMAVALRSFDTTPSPFFTLDLVAPGAQGDKLSLSQDLLVVLDTKNKAVYRLQLSTKASRIVVSSDSLSQAIGISVYGEDIYVAGQAIYQINTPGGLKQVVGKDDEWGKVTQMVVFAGNLYLLDPPKNAVWKYIRGETGFSSRQSYLGPDTQLDLRDAENLSVDGAVWITKPHQVLHLVQGQVDSWSIKGLDEDLGETLKIYSDDTTKNIYLLDQDKSRVVLLDKDGTYLSQYRWKERLAPTDFVVSEPLKKILLLVRGTIYAIDLK